MSKCIDEEIFKLVEEEEKKQINTITLIPSENIVSREVLKIAGSVLTNKYAEGYPAKRYYGGCEYVDTIEEIAVNRACKLFGAEFANVQPHSGSQANMAVYFSILKPGDKILAMDMSAGGHLTHGLANNFSGVFYQPFFYSVDKESESIDYNKVREIAHYVKPKVIVCGASSYSRTLDFQKFSEIAKEVNAFMFADIAHIAGLVAAKIHPSPVEVADFVTSTTHKTLRGPRGGFVLSKKKYGPKLNSSLMPGIQGGPLMHIIAAKAVSFNEALKPEFEVYQQQIIKNSKKLCAEMVARGYRIVSGGTDNHLFVIDLTNKGLTGLEAQELLESVGIITNKNLLPFDTLSPKITSGLRVGTPSVTSRGMKEEEMEKIASWIDETFKYKDNAEILKDISEKIRRFSSEYPIYPQT
ncbi:serine hydroxymethyltransferase [bacterium]|nr:serine hydroxymethyltransferase [bacterium]